MTLIASTTNDNIPIILGDIMVSSERATSVELPTRLSDINPFLDPNMSIRPARFYQKIYIVSPNMAVALSGRLIDMEWFLTKLKDFCRLGQRLTEEIVFDFLKGLEMSERIKNFSFLLLWMEEKTDGKIYPKQLWGPSIQWDKVQSPIFNEVYASGSGAKTFLSRLSEKMYWDFSDPKAKMKTAIAQNMIFLGTILASERTSLYNVHELWGAGFEIIFYGQQGFSKFDQHGFILMEAYWTYKNNLSPIVPRMVQYYEYQNDTLLITAIELKDPQVFNHENANWTISVTNSVRLFSVPAIDSRPNQIESLSWGSSFHTSKLVIGYSIIIDKERATYPGLFFEGEEAIIDWQNNTITVQLPYDITERVRLEIIKSLKGIY